MLATPVFLGAPRRSAAPARAARRCANPRALSVRSAMPEMLPAESREELTDKIKRIKMLKGFTWKVGIVKVHGDLDVNSTEKITMLFLTTMPVYRRRSPPQLASSPPSMPPPRSWARCASRRRAGPPPLSPVLRALGLPPSQLAARLWTPAGGGRGRGQEA